MYIICHTTQLFVQRQVSTSQCNSRTSLYWVIVNVIMKMKIIWKRPKTTDRTRLLITHFSCSILYVYYIYLYFYYIYFSSLNQSDVSWDIQLVVSQQERTSSSAHRELLSVWMFNPVRYGLLMVLNTISIGFINLFEQVEFLECMFFLESVKFYWWKSNECNVLDYLSSRQISMA